MQRIIVFLYYALLCACGGGSLIVEADKEVDRVDVGKNQDNLPYPGFYEIEKEHKLSLLQEDFDYHDGYLDRHESTLRKDQTFYMDVVTREVIENFSDFAQSSSSANINYSSSVEIHRGINVEADYGVSDLFLLAGKVNYVDVILSWEVDEKPEDLKEHKFYICNPQNVYENLFEDFYILPDEAWNVPKSSASKSYALRINRPGKYGLCRQYKDYTPVIYDEINVLEYPGSEFDVSIVNIGAEQLKLNDIKNSQDYFYRAGVNINYDIKLYEYDSPKSFEDEHSKGSFHINNREDYLFVRGPFENEESEHKCYQYIKDDIYHINNRIKHDIQDNILNDRTAVIYNKTHVKFWTFFESENNVYPCYLELTSKKEDEARPITNQEYKVIILNTDIDKCLAWENTTFGIDYNRMYIKHDGNEWGAYDTYNNKFNISQFKEIFNPECHAFVDMDRWQRLNSKETKYLKMIIPGTALGVTDEIENIYNDIFGLWAFINPLNGMQTFMHELGHLLGLSDVDDENNLMNWGNSVGFSLNNRSLTAKKCANKTNAECNWQNFAEMQWDCLNNININTSCLQTGHRNLDWR